MCNINETVSEYELRKINKSLKSFGIEISIKTDPRGYQILSSDKHWLSAMWKWDAVKFFRERCRMSHGHDKLFLSKHKIKDLLRQKKLKELEEFELKLDEKYERYRTMYRLEWKI